MKKFNETVKEKEEREYIIIGNTSANSFINDWLKSQEGKNWEGTSTRIAFSKRAWIHGKGELIKIVNGSLNEFQESIK